MIGAEILLLPHAWQGGCAATYRIDSTARDFDRAIPIALGRIEAVTGIQFAPVAGPADITFMQYPKATIRYEGTDAIGLWNVGQGTVWLTRVAPSLRRYLVTHEAMHALGAAHSNEGNVMGPLVVEGFGQDDLDTLNYISIQNGCDTE